MVHFTETRDADALRLIVHTDTTLANVHEAMRTEPIHDALATKGLASSEHLADAGYVSAGHIVTARERYRVDLVGSARPDQRWQAQAPGSFGAEILRLWSPALWMATGRPHHTVIFSCQ